MLWYTPGPFEEYYFPKVLARKSPQSLMAMLAFTVAYSRDTVVPESANIASHIPRTHYGIYGYPEAGLVRMS